jgi:hypothetical protein
VAIAMSRARRGVIGLGIPAVLSALLVVLLGSGSQAQPAGSGPTPTGSNPYPAWFDHKTPSWLLQAFPWSRLQVVSPEVSTP